MEFSENIQGLDSGCPVSIWDRKRITSLSLDDLEDLRRVVDGLGRLSASAQGLRRPITNLEKLADSDHNLYIASERRSFDGLDGKHRALGILKTGRKKLFIRRGVYDERERERERSVCRLSEAIPFLSIAKTSLEFGCTAWIQPMTPAW